MREVKKPSLLRIPRDELVIILQRISMYNNVVEQLLKKINKRYGKLNTEIEDNDILKELSDNDKRFMDILTMMISLEEKMARGGKRKYSTVYANYARMVDRTASSMTKKSGSYTLNFCLRRGMKQNEILVKQLLSRVNAMIQNEERN